jgi:hypothetical protein
MREGYGITHWKWQPSKILLVANLFPYSGTRSSGLVRHLVGWLLPDVSKERFALSSGLWVRKLTHNPGDEGGTFIWNVGNKLLNHTAQQPWRPVSSTITRWIPQITVSILLRIYLFLITLSFSFILACWRVIDYLWKEEMVKVFILFGYHSPWTHKTLL